MLVQEQIPSVEAILGMVNFVIFPPGLAICRTTLMGDDPSQSHHGETLFHSVLGCEAVMFGSLDIVSTSIFITFSA